MERPVDRGYSWLILLGAVLQMVLTVGIVKSSGLLFVTFQDRFQSNSSVTSLLSTIQNVFYSISSLLVMTVGIKMTTCRKLVFAGSTLICIAFVMTSQADNVYVLLLSYGVLQGIAMALNEPPLLVMLSYYFERMRGFANTIASSGCCVGGLLFAPLIAKLLSVYSYSGCLLIIAGILFNGAISGALFRPVTFYSQIKEKKTSGERLEQDHKKLMQEQNGMEMSRFDKYIDSNPSGIFECSTENVTCPNAKTGITNNINSGDTNRSVREKDKPIKEALLHCTDDCTGRNVKRQHTVSASVASPLLEIVSNSSVARFESSEYLSYSVANINKTVSGGTISVSISEADYKMIKRKVCFQKCFEMFDFGLFKRPVFVCLFISACMTCPGTILSQVFIAPYARDIGVKVEDIATLITIFNIVDLCARILLSFIADRGWVRRSTLAAIATTIIAVAAHLVRYYSSYNILTVYAVILAMVAGVYFSLFSVIVVDYLTLEKLHSCIGFLSLCHGFSIAGTFYLIGYLRDTTGSYIIPYHVIGHFAGVGAILMYLLPFIEKLEKSQLY